MLSILCCNNMLIIFIALKPKIWGELAVGMSWNMGRVVPKFPGRVGTWGELSRKHNWWPGSIHLRKDLHFHFIFMVNEVYKLQNIS